MSVEIIDLTISSDDESVHEKLEANNLFLDLTVSSDDESTNENNVLLQKGDHEESKFVQCSLSSGIIFLNELCIILFIID